MNFRNIIKKLAPECLKEKYRNIREGIIKAEFKFFSLFPIDKDKVVFMNVWGYGDNPKWIAEAYQTLLLETDVPSERLDKIYFVTGKLPQRRKKGIKYFKNNSISANHALATARIWVDCNRKESYITKRKGQCYIQTWHGSLPLKKIEGDCADCLTEKYLENGRRDTSMTDIYISNSEFCNELYRRAFGFTGKIFCFGSARLDPLFKPSSYRVKMTKKKVLRMLLSSESGTENKGNGQICPDFETGTQSEGNCQICLDFETGTQSEGNCQICLDFGTGTQSEGKRQICPDYETGVESEGQNQTGYGGENATRIKSGLHKIVSECGKKLENLKICLYAPTYREDDTIVRKKAEENSPSLVKALEQKFGGKFVVITRMHPLAMTRVSQQDSIYLDFEDDRSVVVNGNDFDDIYILMEAADVLITDYSNTLFEFAYAKKPVFLYAPDCEEYIESRGMYFDYETLPYPIAKDKMQLRRNIINYDCDYYIEKQQAFFEELSLVEKGNASEKLAKLIMKILNR